MHCFNILPRNSVPVIRTEINYFKSFIWGIFFSKFCNYFAARFSYVEAMECDIANNNYVGVIERFQL